ncbi:MAG: tRNA 2-selenouridine(34) synthase MnmH [Draconibacterium sp.]|nr:tRNA 2-selenouridine(34) synthase MnmH [Draconibacterium sp.]
MITKLGIKDFFAANYPLPLIDVRSPGEFEKGHIVGAVNIPLFSNDERAHVGTVYVQQSKEKAVELGYKYVTPKLNWFVEQSRKVAGQSAIAIHCWRGGMRSEAFAEHLYSNGFKEVYILEGGYKAYRNYMLSIFEQSFDLRILGGYTGSGKTYILKELKALGEQVIDLEGVAHHKGSAFGAIGETMQPTQEQFENNLFSILRMCDRKAPIWIEDESHNIGRVNIPIIFFRQIREQTVYFIDISKEKRAEHLVREYSEFGNSLITDAINGIAKRLGGQNVKLAHDYLAQNNYFEVVMLTLHYYDKAYEKGVKSRNQEKVFTLSLPEMNHKDNAKSILKFVEQHERNKTYSI